MRSAQNRSLWSSVRCKNKDPYRNVRLEKDALDDLWARGAEIRYAKRVGAEDTDRVLGEQKG